MIVYTIAALAIVYSIAWPIPVAVLIVRAARAWMRRPAA